jgi:hypothetical protein
MNYLASADLHEGEQISDANPDQNPSRLSDILMAGIFEC